MNTSELASAQKILEHIAGNDGKLTWYNIVRHIDVQDVERIPPPYAVLKALVSEGLLRIEPPEGGNQARYRITDEGRLRLVQPPRS